MANPHPQYPHPGHPHAHPVHPHPGHPPHPGPSAYFPHSPPPPFPYGPNPAFYPYPPPMNGQHSVHPPASPRMNGTPRGAYHPHRAGAPGYPHFQHIPPQHFVPSHTATPTSASPASPFPHPQKFSQHHHPPTQVPYPPPYHPPYPQQPSLQAQAISPLPKQLSMPPPLPPQPPIHEPASQPRPSPVHSYQNTLLPPPVTHSIPQPQIASSLPSPEVTLPYLPPLAGESPILPPSPHLELVEEPPRSPTPPSPQTVFAQVPSQPPSDRAASPEVPASPVSMQHDIVSGWVIWTHKGHPSNAPGIIISPRANPPPDIVQKALQLPSPPPSPKQPAKRNLFTVPPEAEPKLLHDETPEKQDHSPEPTDVPSSSATESTPACSTAPDTPMPGSPISTNTSVSLAPVASPAVEKPVTPTFPVVNKADSVVSEPLAAEATPAIQDQPIASEPVTSTNTDSVTPSIISSAPTPTPSGLSSATPTPASVSTLEPLTSATVPVPPKPAPLKKSWASLLQPSDKPSSSKSRLPVSSVVGFSIPASSMSQSTSGSSAKAPARPELFNLLQNGPTGPSPPPKIRPRGLVNTGNMCFANAVLQVLVYCPQFNRLFMELGKYLSGPVIGSQKEGTKATPLVDATIQFLKEFMPPATTPGGGDSKAKGKEKEGDDFYEPESFIPTFVYDLMKEKKRFANMVGGHQEDAEEFLGFFLDTLEEELLSIANSYNPENPKTNGPIEEHQEPEVPHDDGWFEVGKRNRMAVTRTIKSAESPITRIFGGKFRSTLRAPHQRDSVTIEDWRALRLDIQRDQIHNVKEALQLISHPQSVQITSPTRPGVVIDASQQTLIESLPPILVLHMKRFHYDTDVKDVVKIGKQVAFGPDLEISADLISPAVRKSSQPVKYQLFGVLYHHGLSASGGHYTLDVLHPNRDMNDRPRAAWIRIDDELVSDIRADDVFGAESDRDDRCAYLLFYRRIGAGISSKAWAQHVAGAAHAK